MFNTFYGWLCILLAICLSNTIHADTQISPKPTAVWAFAESLSNSTGQVTFTAYALDNQPAPDAVLPIKAEDNQPASITLKPGHFLRYRGSSNHALMQTGTQTIWTRIKIGPKPQGIIWSRHRPQDGLRGIELGLTAKHGWNADGPRPCITVSGGDRSNTVFLVSEKPLQANTWYDLFVCYQPGKSVELYVIQSLTGQLVTYQINTKDIPDKINPMGGENILTLSARRYSSIKNADELSSASCYANFAVWNQALSESAIESIVGKSITKPQAMLKREPQTFHVSAKNGTDQADGLTPQTAFGTIGRATQQLIPGDTVLIAPGVYTEQVRITDHGTADNPITIKATDSQKNAVVLTLADPTLRQGKVRWECVDEKLQLYRTSLDHWPARVLYDQIGLMPYPNLDTLKTFTLFDDYPGPTNGFTYDLRDKMLYVRLEQSGQYGSTNPNEHVMAASPINAHGSNGHTFSPNGLDANLVIEGDGDGHVVIQGLTFETPGAVGVLAMRHHVTVKDCTFIGCRFGVGGRAQSPDESRTTHHVTVDHCDYSNKPVFEDTMQVIKKYHNTPIAKKHTYYWWHRKGHNTDRTNIKNDETGILGNVGSHWVLKNSNIHHAFEGLATWGVRWAKDLKITHNRFYKLVDNAIETEDHAADVTIAYNWIEDVFEPISWQPLGGTPWPGPVFIHDNVITQSESFGKIWQLVGHMPGAFKIGASGKNWARDHMGATGFSDKNSLISKRFVAVPGAGFVVYHNTVFMPQGNLLSLPHPTYGPMARELANFRFFNNLIVTNQLYARDDWQGSLMEFDGNLNVCLNTQSQTASITAGAHGKVMQSIEQAGLTNPQQNSFSLKPQSLANNMGITIPQLIATQRPVGVDWNTVKDLAALIDYETQSDSGQ